MYGKYSPLHSTPHHTLLHQHSPNLAWLLSPHSQSPINQPNPTYRTPQSITHPLSFSQQEGPNTTTTTTTTLPFLILSLTSLPCISPSIKFIMPSSDHSLLFSSLSLTLLHFASPRLAIFTPDAPSRTHYDYFAKPRKDDGNGHLRHDYITSEFWWFADYGRWTPALLIVLEYDDE